MHKMHVFKAEFLYLYIEHWCVCVLHTEDTPEARLSSEHSKMIITP